MSYSIMTPDQVGVTAHQYIMGKHSGRHAFREKLKAMGHLLEEAAFEQAFVRMKELADKKKRVFDEDIEAIVTSQSATGPEKFLLEDVRFQSGTNVTPRATVKLKVKGKLKAATATGDGPVDADFQAVRKLTHFKGTLAKFSINALTGGTDAQGEVTVALEEGGRTVRGVGSHTDIVVASVRAFLSALNRLESPPKAKPAEKGI